jgi:hypothetical protein
MTRETLMSKNIEREFTAEQCTLSMYTLKLNGSSASPTIDDMDEPEIVLLIRCPQSEWKNMGLSASSATMPEKIGLN